MSREEALILGSPDIKVGLSPCRSDQESCDLGRKRLIHGFFWDLSLSSVSLPLSTAAYAGPALAGGPARRLPRVDVKCSIYGCYSMTDGLETPRKLCRFAELRPTLMSGDSNFGRGDDFRPGPTTSQHLERRSERNMTDTSRTGGAPTILVVEDEPPLRRLIRAALEKRGYVVIEARNGTRRCHAAFANLGGDLVGAEGRARLQRHQSTGTRRVSSSNQFSTTISVAGGDASSRSRIIRNRWPNAACETCFATVRVSRSAMTTCLSWPSVQRRCSRA